MIARAMAVVAGALALAAVVRWLWAVSLGGPVLYGEGAVARAALLARQGAEYAPVAPPGFVAANYTPLFFHLAAPDPFLVGRLVSIASALVVAGAIAWRARAAGPLVAGTLAFLWIALAPVALWGAAVKPDLVAVALTVLAVEALAREPRRAAAAAVLVALAVWTKPTAALPALALLVWIARTGDRRALAAYAGAGLVTAAVLAAVTPGGLAELREHVIERNALAYDVTQLAALVLLGLGLVGIVVLGAVAVGVRGAAGAYLVGALGIVALGGREGATINYLLDLGAASLLLIAAAAQRVRVSRLAAAALVVQLALGAALVDAYGTGTRLVSTGRWGDPARIAAVRSLALAPGDLELVEDSGLTIAAGRTPLVDDVFLWSRLADRGAIDPAPLERAVRDGAIAWIVVEADLARLDEAPGYVRQRWRTSLVEAIGSRYALERIEAGLYLYRPR